MLRRIRRLSGQRVLLRVDFNVPIIKKKVADDTRLVQALPTIKFLIKKKAKIIIVTHLGRPEGKFVEELKLDPVAKRLSELLKQKINKLSYWSGSKVEKAISRLQNGNVVLLENIRFSSEESGNKGTLAREWAVLADIFVQDGFAVCHRADASVAGVPRYLPSYAGLLLENEIKGLTHVLQKSRPPFIVVLGGVKMETKIPVIKNLLPKADNILVGGGIVNTYLHAAGYEVGDSLVDKDYGKAALAYCKKRKVVLPIDVAVCEKDGKTYRIVELHKKPHFVCGAGEKILDIGPESIKLFSSFIGRAQTIVWNGAMGYFEQKPFDAGTLSVAKLVAVRSKGKAFGVIGGGETVQAMELTGLGRYVDLVSTGGGAMLEFLAGKKLPGIEALVRKR